MKTISVVEAQKQLTDLIEDLKGGAGCPFYKGRPCAALVGLDEHFDRESFSLGGTGLYVGCSTKRAGKPWRRGIPFSEILREVDRQHPSGKRPRGADVQRIPRFRELGRVLCHEPETSEIPS